jgi:N-acetylglucosaminyl-diphospho-decaprenol L-rhamnosyltransferase
VTATPRAAVVIVSFETREALLTALASVRSAAGLPVETVVVDNASTDGSADAVVRAASPDTRVIANTENVGFARACNQGWRATRAPLVLFLNPDAELLPGALPALAGLLDARPDVGAAGPRTRNPDGSVQVSTGPDLGLLSEWRQRRLVLGVARRDPGALAEAEARHTREHEPGWVSGSCLMVRRTALEAISGFDEGYFLYEEDADLCRRLRKAGWRIAFTPAAEVRHHVGLSMSQASRRARLEYHRSHLRYYRLHTGLASRTTLRVLLASRGAWGWLRGAATRDEAARSEGAALVRLGIGGR